MNLKKTLVASAIATGLGLSGIANAATVVSWHLEDWEADGDSSDFGFYAPPSGTSANQFAAGTGDGAAFANGTAVPVFSLNAATAITTGFNFGGTGIFEPEVQGAGFQATISGGVLEFSALPFGGVFPIGGTTFVLAPDVVSPNGTGGFGSGPATTATLLPGLGSGTDTYGVTVRYVGTINDPGGSFHNFQANWYLEGVMVTSAVPVPAAAWLFGSGLLGLVGVARRKKQA